MGRRLTILAKILPIILGIPGFIAGGVYLDWFEFPFIGEETSKSSDEDSAIDKIVRQNFLDSYQKGLPYKIEIDSCSYYEENKKIEFKLNVMDKQNIPSIIPFEITVDFGPYVVDKEDMRTYYDIIPYQTFVYVPGDQKVLEVFLTEFFEEASGFKDSTLYMRSKYSYAPYFEETNSTVSSYILDENGHLLVGLIWEPISEKWIKNINNKNIVCS